MNANKMTQKTLETLQQAQSLAEERRNTQVGQIHVFHALLDDPDDLNAQLMASMGISTDELRAAIDTELDKQATFGSSGGGQVYMTPELNSVLTRAEEEAKRMGDSFVSVEHIMLGLIERADYVVKPLLKRFGIVRDKYLEALKAVRGNSRVNSDNPESTYDVLNKYGQDLTELARAQKLDPVIGRDNEIRSVIRILSRKTKNNPCLIGEAGVGKTAIAEGIAERIAKGQVPIGLRDKEIFLLDLTSLVAGTQFRGQFEQRVKGLLNEVKAAGNVILFIDEIHTITSAGESEGAMNAGNILKPALSRGEIQVIGATTFNEYRKYIEKDQALERRFQPVRVEEPSVADTLAVMNGIKHYYEQHHHVQVPADVLSATVTLSERYITDRYLPDKAIDLLDEACACCNLAHPVISEYLGMQKELDALKQEEAEMENADVNEPIDYERVAERKTRIAKLEADLPAKQAAASEIQVTMDDVAKVIELWTGIPAVKIRETEFAKLANLEGELKKKIIGQDEAVHLVAQAIKRSRADLSGRRRPASFIFVGPTGVGKTELVKQLANQLFDGPDPLIRLDMSEYMEKYAVSRMIGSPPGYVGYEEAGQLTEKVRRKPYSVVLFDEIEKAHEDVWNILLQLLDDGRITDSQGRTVDFKNTVIVMTSNIGAKALTAAGAKLGFDADDKKAEADADAAYAQAKETVLAELRQTFRPEFLNRIDDIIVFRPLTEEDIREVARRMLKTVSARMETMGIHLDASDEAVAELAKEGFDPKYGARPLRRAIQSKVEDAVAEKMLDGTLKTGDTAKLAVEDDKLVVTK